MGIHQKHQPATLHAAENASRISLNKGGRGGRRGNNRDSSQRILAYESNPISCFCRCSFVVSKTIRLKFEPSSSKNSRPDVACASRELFD